MHGNGARNFETRKEAPARCRHGSSLPTVHGPSFFEARRAPQPSYLRSGPTAQSKKSRQKENAAPLLLLGGLGPCCLYFLKGRFDWRPTPLYFPRAASSLVERELYNIEQEQQATTKQQKPGKRDVRGCPSSPVPFVPRRHNKRQCSSNNSQGNLLFLLMCCMWPHRQAQKRPALSLPQSIIHQQRFTSRSFEL